MKKKLSLIFTIMISVFSVFTFFDNIAFADNTNTTILDIKQSDNDYSIVQNVVGQKWMQLFKGKFYPDQNVSRGEFTAILAKVNGDMNNLLNPAVPTFKDVDKKYPYYNFIETEKRYFTYSNKAFKPYSFLTREDAAYAIVKSRGYDLRAALEDGVLGDIDMDNIIDDYDNISLSLRKYVAIAINNELINLYDNKDSESFKPKQYITRKQLAVLLYNASQKGFYYPVKLQIDKVQTSVTDPNISISGKVYKNTILTINSSKVKVNDDGTFKANYVLPKEGWNDFNIVADFYGTKTSMQKSIKWVISQPVITVSGIPNATNNDWVPLSITVKDLYDKNLYAYINNSKITLKNGSWNGKVVDLDEGKNAITIKSSNSHGKVTSVTKYVNVSFNAPELTVKCPASSTKSKITISGTVSDVIDSNPRVLVNDNPATVKDGKWSAEVSLQNGDNSIVIQAVNKKEKVKEIDKTVHVDFPVPELNVLSCPASVNTNKATITGTLTDKNDPDPILTIDDDNVTIDDNGKWSYTLDLYEGQNDVTIKAQNSFGATTTINRSINVDLKAPVLTINDFPNTSYAKTIQISGSLRDDQDINPTLKINDQDVDVNSSGNWSYSIDLSEGANSITLKASNDLGKEVEVDKSVTYIVNGPTISLDTIPDTINSKTLKISGTVKDDNDNYPDVYVNDSRIYDISSGTFSKNINLSEGFNTITVKAKNDLGKVTTITKMVNVVLNGPTVTINNIPDNVTSDTITISGSVKDDNDSRPSMYINKSSVYVDYNGNWSKSITLTEGLNQITINAIDSGKKTYNKTITINYTIGSPILNITDCPDSTNYGKITIKGNVSDAQDNYPDVYVNGNEVNVYSGNWSYDVSLSEGLNKITIKATNKYGKQISIDKNVTMTIVGPVIDVSQVPATANKQKINISGKITDYIDSYDDLHLYINGSPVYIGYSGDWETTIELNNGQNTITFKGTNSNGKTTVINKIIDFQLVPPTLTVNVPDKTNSPNIKVSGKVSDAVDQSPEVSINDEDVYLNYDGSFSTTVKLENEGINNVVVKAKSSSGQSTTVTKSVYFEVLPPVLNATIPSTSETSTFMISGNVSDLLGGTIAVTVNGDDVYVNSSGNWNCTLKLNSGSNDIIVVAKNQYGKTTIVENYVNYSPK